MPPDDLLDTDDSPSFDFGGDQELSFDADLHVDALEDLEAVSASPEIDSLEADLEAVPSSPEIDPLEADPALDLLADDDEALTFDGGGEMPMPAGFDGAEDADSADRIQELLSEGQAQFETGQYQDAIDVWSRIFLIDIDHAEATRRIEEARSKKDELDRQAEEHFQAALDQIESEQLEDAKASLAQVLELQPNHPAREYLDQLEAGQVPVVNRADHDPAIDLLDDGGFGDLQAASLQGDGGQSMEAAVARDRVVVTKRTDRRLISLAAGVGLLVVVGIGFLALKWDDIFRNTDDSATQAKPPRVDPIARATKMFEAGKIQNAILLLEKLPSNDDSFEEAKALITQWKAMVDTPQEEEDKGPSEEMMQRRELLAGAGREAFQLGSFIRARRYFDRANKILPLGTEDLAMRRECDYKLEPLDQLIADYEAAKYKTILPLLWRFLDDDPNNPDVKLLIVDSYYNLALTDLQRGDPAGAGVKLGDALEIDPENEELQRMKLFADTYASRQPDLLYRIYVKYLPSRA